MSRNTPLPLEVGFKKSWNGTHYRITIEVKEKVEVYPCEKCPCRNFDGEWGYTCNLDDSIEIESYVTKLVDDMYYYDDETIDGAKKCPLIKVVTAGGDIQGNDPVEAYVVKRDRSAI